MVARHEVWLVRFDPAVGAEIKNTWPAVIVSPDQMNRHLRMIAICPLTSTIKNWPTRIAVRFNDRPSEIAIDQIRSIDRMRLVRKLGVISEAEAEQLHDALVRAFRA